MRVRLCVAAARLALRLSGRRYYVMRDVTAKEEAENDWLEDLARAGERIWAAKNAASLPNRNEAP